MAVPKRKTSTSKKKMRRSRHKISSINIIHQKRFEGDGNYSAKKLFNLWFDMIENFHFYPLRFGSFIGIISFLIVKLIRIFKKKFFFTYKIKSKTF